MHRRYGGGTTTCYGSYEHRHLPSSIVHEIIWVHRRTDEWDKFYPIRLSVVHLCMEEIRAAGVVVAVAAGDDVHCSTLPPSSSKRETPLFLHLMINIIICTDLDTYNWH